MRFHLRSIILWSFDSSFEPQIIPFEPGMVNVVMGSSRTGKSAVIPIIDYCLCSSSCAIPKKVIRTACEWFGIIVETDEGQKLFARKNPGHHDATEEMFVAEGFEVEIPQRIVQPNAAARAVKRELDKLANLSHLDFAGGDVVNRFDYRLGFRDLMAFVFQPQNIVANRDILFYRTEKLEYRTRLARNTLPYVLGAVSAKVLGAQHELERLNRELRRKQRDLERAREASSRWESEMAGQLTRADELGLLENDASTDLAPDSILVLLRGVAKKTVDEFHANSTTITRAVEELMRLEAEEDNLAKNLAELKSRQGDLGRLREGAGGYHEALLVQRERLAISEWLSALPSSDGTDCPVCGGSLESERIQLGELKEQLVHIEASAGQLVDLPLAVDREVQQIRHSIDDVAEKLGATRRRKQSLTQSSEEARNKQFQSLAIAHFLGQLSQALNLYDEVQDTGELPLEIEELERQIRDLSASVDEAEIRRRKEAAIERISTYISRFMPQLDNDHQNDAARLDVEDLTLRINSTDGESYLWSVGSGSNHLSYHLATLLALHCFFLDMRQSPVPALLVIDQPSQVYFPEKIHRKGKSSDEPWKNDEDCAAVRKAFELLGKVVGSFNGNLQVIVLDHAPEEVWGHLPNVTLAEDWRSGSKLVPTEWPGVNN